MIIQFKKYQGTGNDFVMLDNREGKYNGLTKSEINFLCNRRFGIGADGLILLQNLEGYSFEMVYYNSDGAQSSMCGNGGRCIAQFAKDIGITGKTYTFIAIDGLHEAEVGEIVRLKMGNVDKVEKKENDYFTDTGSPHYIRFASDIMQADLLHIAKKIRYSSEYAKEGTNVNLIEILGNDTLQMRTYERGVEDETYSCGTGVTAAAIVGYAAGNLKHNNIKVHTKGGDLGLSFEESNGAYSNIWLSGKATFVFDGTIEL